MICRYLQEALYHDVPCIYYVLLCIIHLAEMPSTALPPSGVERQYLALRLPSALLRQLFTI